MADSKPDVRLLVTARERDRTYQPVTLSAVVIEDGHIRNITWNHYSSDRSEQLADFEIHAQCDLDRDDPADNGRWYGYEACFGRPYRVELAQAKSMVKVLTKVQRDVEAHSARFGRPTDFAAYVAVVAHSIGSTSDRPYIRARGKVRGWSYDDGEYAYMDVDGLRYHLADLATGKTPTEN